MTTLKPQLIRADTLDLQSHDSPSAKDHSKQPMRPAPLGIGPAAPHQNQALRHAEQEQLNEQAHSPRLATDPTHDQGFYDDHDDDYDGPNGMHDDEEEFGDQDADDSMDDDMMDKISSSPSIDDGKYTLPPVWPTRMASRLQDSLQLQSPLSESLLDDRSSSSSPFTSPPDHLPLTSSGPITDNRYHHQGRYLNDKDELIFDAPTELPREIESRQTMTNFLEQYRETEDDKDIQKFLLPLNDPLLEDDQNTLELDDQDFSDDSEWEDEDEEIQFSNDSDDDDDDGSDDFDFTTDFRFIDSGWGGECLRELEDIDFEFVYALHTFVATVEGQANATKGDTMVLLDDSNSYWWLVRVVKDGSIGYLPAEHIETPTERLARLNKHRNIDLSATMLGDNPEKSKNPLKKAMRRRNAKQVQFAAPTYHEAPEIDYSDEEDDEGTDMEGEQDDQVDEPESNTTQEGPRIDATSVVEPLRLKSAQPSAGAGEYQRGDSNESLNDRIESPEKERTSDELFDRRDETVSRSRNGTVRNTDSFFKDDTAETKKISLTPRLLRGDSDSLDSEPVLKGRPSLEDKLVADDKSDKKKKEKKPGVLSGLFKRKEKKGKTQEADDGDLEKISVEYSRGSPQPRESSDNLSQDAKSKAGQGPQRNPSKLQKNPPNLAQPQTSASPKASPTKDDYSKESPPISQERSLSPTSKPTIAPLTVRQVQPSDSIQPQQAQQSVASPEAQERELSSANRQEVADNQKTNGYDRPALASSPIERTIQTASTMEDVPEEEEEDDDITPPATQQITIPSKPVAQPTPASQVDRLSISPVEVSPIEPTEQFTAQPPGLVHDTSSSDRRSVSPISPSVSSVTDQEREVDQATSPTTLSPHADPHSPATTNSTTPSWSDAALRSYMENDEGIRDLLIIVHDKSNVVPAGPDHPITGNLFGAEKGRLAEMQSNLDNMLTGWLTRKSNKKQPA